LSAASLRHDDVEHDGCRRRRVISLLEIVRAAGGDDFVAEALCDLTHDLPEFGLIVDH
jgi:hypothetical protein